MQKHQFITNEIRNRILQGEYGPNEQLPFERDLCLTYNSSKMTVKKALDKLVSEGLIVKKRGSGTYVKELGLDEMQRLNMANQFQGLTALNTGKSVTSHILDFHIIPCPLEICPKLNLTAESLVYHIYRCRSVDGHPSVMEKTYMPVELIPGLKRSIVSGSIYNYIEEDLALKMQSTHRTITVRKCTEIEQKHLELQPGDPVAVADQVAYLDNGQAFETSVSVHRYDSFALETVITKQ